VTSHETCDVDDDDDDDSPAQKYNKITADTCPRERRGNGTRAIALPPLI